MNKFLLTLSFAVFATASLISGQQQKCDTKDFGTLITNPENCASYIQCGKDGTAYVMPCSKGLEWNDDGKVCDWPSSSTCTKNKEAKKANRNQLSQKCDTKDFGTLITNPEDCASYIQCADDGTAYVMPCSEGLEWNDDAKVCDWPSQSTCTKNGVMGRPKPTTARPTRPPPPPPTTQRPTRPPPTTQRPTRPPPTPSRPPRPDFDCPTADIAATSCLGPKDCLYPNPGNCNSYIQCEVNADNTTGSPVVRPCPSDLEWNDDERICDWPENSTCNGRTKPPTTTRRPTRPPTTTRRPTTTQRPTRPPTTTRRPTTTQRPTRPPTTTRRPTTTQRPTRPPTTTRRPTRPPTSAPGQCPPQDIADTGCKGPKDCLYPNPENCNSYIQCTVNADNVTGTPVVRPCPDDLEWNDNDKICDWPSSSTCNGQTAAPTTTRRPTRPPTTTSRPTRPPTTTRRPTRPPTTTRRPTRPPPTPEPTTTPSDDDDETTTAPPTETTTDAETTTEAATTGPPACEDDTSEDDNLNLDELCRGCRRVRRNVANPNSNRRYIECNGGENNDENSVRKCSPGLLFDSNRLTCDYAGLVDPNGPSK